MQQQSQLQLNRPGFSSLEPTHLVTGSLQDTHHAQASCKCLDPGLSVLHVTRKDKKHLYLNQPRKH